MSGQKAADTDTERRLVSQHTGIGGAVERGRVITGVVGAQSLSHQRAPFLAEDLPRHHQLDPEGSPVEPARDARVDNIFEEWRVSQQDHLLKGRAKLLDDAEDLLSVVARRDD